MGWWRSRAALQACFTARCCGSTAAYYMDMNARACYLRSCTWGCGSTAAWRCGLLRLDSRVALRLGSRMSCTLTALRLASRTESPSCDLTAAKLHEWVGYIHASAVWLQPTAFLITQPQTVAPRQGGLGKAQSRPSWRMVPTRPHLGCASHQRAQKNPGSCMSCWSPCAVARGGSRPNNRKVAAGIRRARVQRHT